MSNPINLTVGCQMVGDYVDEAELPPNLVSPHGEVVRPQVVASYLDLWGKDDGFKEFTVLLRDGRIVAVRGQGLKHFPAGLQGESGAYGVIVRTGGEDVLVALFTVLEVVGIFHGEIRSERRIA